MHLKSFTRKLRLLTIIFPLIALAGCWGNGSGPSSTPDAKRPPEGPPPPLRDSAVDGGFEPSADTGMPSAVFGNQGGCGAGNLGAWPYFNCNFVTSTLGPSSAPVSHDVPGTQSLIQFGIDAGAENSITALEGDRVEVTVYAMSWEPDPFNNLGIVQLSFWDQPGGRAGGGQQLGAIERFAGSSAGDFNFILLPQDGAEIDDWTEITFSGTAPAGSMSAQVLLLHVLLPDTPANGALYWDDLRLESFGGEPVEPEPEPEPEPDYQLLWFDEFDLDGEPNPNYWTMEEGYGNFGWGNDEWQLYTNHPENVRVENGTLVIDALCEDDPVDPEPGASLEDGGFEPPGTNDASAADQACLGGVLAGSAWDCFNNNFVTANDGPNSGPVSHDSGGNQSLKQFGFDGGATNTIEAFEGDTVDLSAWAMNWAGDPFKSFAILELTFWDGPNASGNQIGQPIESLAEASGTNPNATDLSVIQDGADVSDWTEMSLSAVAPAGAQSAKVSLLHLDFGGGGAIYWDDVSLTATPPVEPSVCGGKRDGSITSARINTSGKFDFKYGKVEARIQVPVGEGAWPAFWMLGANFKDVGWPFSGEVDIMEVFSNGSDEYTTSFAMHWCDENKQTDPDVCFPQDQGWTFVSSKRSLFPESLGDDYHVYSAVWDEDRIVGKIDGQTYFTRAIDADTMDEFLKEFFMILNVAIGGTLGGAPDATTTWPQRMLVDWVRVYQEVP